MPAVHMMATASAHSTDPSLKKLSFNRCGSQPSTTPSVCLRLCWHHREHRQGVPAIAVGFNSSSCSSPCYCWLRCTAVADAWLRVSRRAKEVGVCGFAGAVDVVSHLRELKKHGDGKIGMLNEKQRRSNYFKHVEHGQCSTL